jgi:hypothetical protein
MNIVCLWQQTLGGSRQQYWEFIKQPDEKIIIMEIMTDSKYYCFGNIISQFNGIKSI